MVLVGDLGRRDLAERTVYPLCERHHKPLLFLGLTPPLVTSYFYIRRRKMIQIFIGGDYNRGSQLSNRKHFSEEPSPFITFSDPFGSYQFRSAFSTEKTDVYVEKSLTDQEVLKLLLASYMKWESSTM